MSVSYLTSINTRHVLDSYAILIIMYRTRSDCWARDSGVATYQYWERRRSYDVPQLKLARTSRYSIECTDHTRNSKLKTNPEVPKDLFTVIQTAVNSKWLFLDVFGKKSNVLFVRINMGSLVKSHIGGSIHRIREFELEKVSAGLLFLSLTEKTPENSFDFVWDCVISRKKTNFKYSYIWKVISKKFWIK